MVQTWSSTNLSTLFTGGGTTTVTIAAASQNGSWQSALGSEGAADQTRALYWEVQYNLGGSSNTTTTIGIGLTTMGLTSSFVGEGPESIGLTGQGHIFYGSTDEGLLGPTYASGDRVAVELDTVGRTIKWRNVSQAGAWSATWPINSTVYSSTMFPAAGTPNDAASSFTQTITGYFASNLWNGSPESGYSAWDVTALPSGDWIMIIREKLEWARRRWRKRGGLLLPEPLIA